MKNKLIALDEQFIMNNVVCKPYHYQKDVAKQILKINEDSVVAYLVLDGGSGKTLLVRLITNSTHFTGDTLYLATRNKIIADAKKDFTIDYKDLQKKNRDIHCYTLNTIYELAQKFYTVSDKEDFEPVKKDFDVNDLDDKYTALYQTLRGVTRVALDEFHMYGTRENNRMINLIKVFFKEYFDIQLWLPISATMWPISADLFGDPKAITATYDSAELQKQGFLNPAMLHSIETGRALSVNTVKQKLREVSIDMDDSIIDQYFKNGAYQDDDDLTVENQEFVFDSVEKEHEKIKDENWQVTHRIKDMFKRIRVKDSVTYVISQEKDEQGILYVPDNYNGNDYVSVAVDYIRQLGHTAEGYHGAEEDLPDIISRWEKGEFQILVCKSMLIEAYDRKDLEWVLWARSVGNGKSPQEAQAYKRVRRINKDKNGNNQKKPSRCYRAIDWIAVNAKKASEILDKLTTNPDFDGELTEEQKALARELQAAKIVLNNDKEMDEKQKKVLIEEAEAKKKDLDEILNGVDNETTKQAMKEAQEGGEISGGFNTVSTPLVTITDVKQGYFEKTMSMDWYDAFDAKWDMNKGKREARKVLESMLAEKDYAV